MRRRTRLGLAVATVAGSVAVVLGLIELGIASEGPITTLGRAVGGAVTGLEGRVARRVRGPGRAAQLHWLEPLRTSADSLRHPDTLLLGAYDGRLPTSLEGVIALEETLGTRFPLIQLYTAWGDGPDHAFPARVVQAIRALGSIPVITWEPWLTTFENRAHPDLPLREGRDRGGLEDVAAGMYDFYLDAWFAQAAALDYPVLVRFAHEMNDPYRYPWGPQNNGPQHFIAAWRHVVGRARAAGADNLVWVWSPHIAYDGYEVYWPGDDYVDWVATGALNYGTVAYWSRWWSFQQVFGDRYEFLAGFGKPIMIAEFGTLAVGGAPSDWYRDALTGFRDRFPDVHALLFFHVDDDGTVTRQAVDWAFDDRPDVVRAIRRTLTCPDCPAPE